MKKLLYALLFLPLALSAQPNDFWGIQHTQPAAGLTWDTKDELYTPLWLPELISRYEAYCAELVPDTTVQTGTVSYELVPVKSTDGQTIQYVYANPDTVWQEPDCPEFKFPARNDHFLLTAGNGTWTYGSLLVSGSPGPIYSSEKMERQKVNITRQYVCMVKRREVEPFSADFWNWLKKPLPTDKR